jgi:hypothetical protein
MTMFFIRTSTAYYFDLQTILMLAWVNYEARKAWDDA